MDLVSLKRERFRVDIRKRFNEEEFKKKRVLAIESLQEPCENVRVEQVRQYMNELLCELNDKQIGYADDVTELFEYLVEQDFINEMLMHFQGNNVNLKLNVYWILNNLTLGEDVVPKLIFDLNFKLLDQLMSDLNCLVYAQSAIEVLENMMADKDIDVFEEIMKQDGLLKALNNNQVLNSDRIHSTIIQICCCVVKYKYESTDYLIGLLIQRITDYKILQAIYILMRGMPMSCAILIQEVAKSMTNYNGIIDTQSDILRLKILDQVVDYDIMESICTDQFKWKLYQLLKQEGNYISDLVLRLIATITEMNYKLIDIPEILPCVVLHAKNYNVAAIKLISIWIPIEKQQQLVSYQLFEQLINKIDMVDIKLTFVIMGYISVCLMYGDDVNDTKYQEILNQNISQIHRVHHSSNEELSKLAISMLQCYEYFNIL